MRLIPEAILSDEARAAAAGAEAEALRLRAPAERSPVIAILGLLAAAGSTLMKGGKVEGRLTGLARLRLPGGDVDFPIEFPVKLSLR